MKNSWMRWMVIAMVVIIAAGAAVSVRANPPRVAAAAGPELITGEFEYSNDIIETYYVEHAVTLLDMTGFVTRNLEWELPVDSQVLGYLKLDTENNKGSYRLQLPVHPAGKENDVDNNDQKNTGVEIFAVGYSPNLTGGPYSEGDDPSRGWPSYLASVQTDTENKDEVIGGKLVIWSPDDQQAFPTGFGDDGLLFTQDDPAGPVPAGWSVIDLDQSPFAISVDAKQSLTLYEPKDVAYKDYTSQSYSEAFDSMFNLLKKEYAFNGVTGKAPDWDKVYAEIAPKVKEAETNKDGYAFYKAIREFAFAFKDGHVGLNGGDYDNQYFSETAGGGYGLALRELDDGSVVVIYVTPESPADNAGIKVGAVVTSWNGDAIGDAISKVQPVSGPFSTDFGLRYQQTRYLTRAPLDAEVEVTFKNENESEKTATLKAVEETQSQSYTSIYRGSDPYALPVEYKILDTGVGYIKINSNYDDLNLVIRLFQRALTVFKGAEVNGIIIDMRQNSGGAPLGLAGFLTNQKITMGQLQYYSDKSGKFEDEGLPDMVFPNLEQFKFDKEVLLVGQACFSACEIEAYGFSQVKGMVVIGQYPTGGVEAEVSRGQFYLPENLFFQAPTGRMVLPDGSIFLEGKGVQPTVKVPINLDTVFADGDPVLSAAENEILK